MRKTGGRFGGAGKAPISAEDVHFEVECSERVEWNVGPGGVAARARRD